MSSDCRAAVFSRLRSVGSTSFLVGLVFRCISSLILSTAATPSVLASRFPFFGDGREGVDEDDDDEDEEENAVEEEDGTDSVGTVVVCVRVVVLVLFSVLDETAPEKGKNVESEEGNDDDCSEDCSDDDEDDEDEELTQWLFASFCSCSPSCCSFFAPFLD